MVRLSLVASSVLSCGGVISSGYGFKLCACWSVWALFRRLKVMGFSRTIGFFAMLSCFGLRLSIRCVPVSMSVWALSNGIH